MEFWDENSEFYTVPSTPFKTLNTTNSQVNPYTDGELYSLDIVPIMVDGAIGGTDPGQ